MQETLVIELTREHPTQPHWVCFDDKGSIISEAIQGDPAQLAALSLERYIIVLLPALDFTLLSVALPPMNKQRLQQALPFSVEEQLLQEVDTLHIAPLFAEQAKEGEMPVLVIERAKMQHWMQVIKGMGVAPDLVTSSFFAVPYQPHEATILLANPCVCRFAQYQGLLCDIDNISLVLPTLSKNIIAYRDAASVLSHPLSPELVSQETVLESAALFRVMARFVLTERPINLLQGRYQSRKIHLPKGLFFKTLAVLACTWFVMLLSYPIISYAILKVRLYSLNQEITTIYKKHFPGASQVSAPRIRMEDRMASLTSAANENKLLLLLAYFGKALKEVPNVDIKRLNYTDRDVTLEVTANAAQEVSVFITTLSQQGVKVTQQNANLSGDKVSVNLLVGFV